MLIMFSTPHSVLHGLDLHGANFYLDLLREHGFNLLRIPISLAAALNLDLRPRYHYFADATFRDKTVGQLLQVERSSHPVSDRHLIFPPFHPP